MIPTRTIGAAASLAAALSGPVAAQDTRLAATQDTRPAATALFAFGTRLAIPVKTVQDCLNIAAAAQNTVVCQGRDGDVIVTFACSDDRRYPEIQSRLCIVVQPAQLGNHTLRDRPVLRRY